MNSFLVIGDTNLPYRSRSFYVQHKQEDKTMADMTDKEMRTICGGCSTILRDASRGGMNAVEIAEGLKAGIGSDYLNLSEALEKSHDVVDPMKYARAADGKAEQPRKARPLERDISKAIDNARRQTRVDRGSEAYRAQILQQKRAEIHKALDKKGVNSFHSHVNGYDLDIIRDPVKNGLDGKPQLKMFVNGNEISDRCFDQALAEVAGVNNSKAFDAGAEIGKNLKDQAAIQSARMVTQAGLNVATAPARAIPRAIQSTDIATSQALGKFLSIILAVSRSSYIR